MPITTPPPPSVAMETDRWMVKSGLRPTRQRRELAALLIGAGDRHVTAEVLYEEACEAGVTCSLATVYNTLRAFTCAGLLREVNIEAGRVYYDTRTDDHPHFLFEDTGQIMDAPAGSVKIASLPDAPDGAEITMVDIVLRVRRKRS